LSGGLDAGYGGLPCPLCDEFALGAGLRSDLKVDA
jgi:hypothetical protein